MNSIDAVAYMGLAHWIGDFVLQSHYMSVNKSKNCFVLVSHVCVWTTAMTLGFIYTVGFRKPFDATVLIMWFFTTHFIIDYITSRITAAQWQRKQVHDFFVTIGFDQWLHLLTILFAIKFL